MYSILNEALGWKEDVLPTEKLMLISDSLAADGAFLLPHFVNFYIKNKQRVVLVGLEQGFSHYLALSKKLVRIEAMDKEWIEGPIRQISEFWWIAVFLTFWLLWIKGVNLQQAHNAGQIAYVNGIAAPYDWTDAVTTETKNSNSAAIQGIANAHPFSLPSQSEEKSGQDPLKSLYMMVEKLVGLEDARSVCLIFDNLSALSPSVSEPQLIQFIHSCHALIHAHADRHSNASSVVALAHHDVDSLLISSLSYSADLVLKVEGFKTGYSNEEDGQVRDLKTLFMFCYSFPLFCSLTALFHQLSFFSADPFKFRHNKPPILIYKLAEANVNFRIVRK